MFGKVQPKAVALQKEVRARLVSEFEIIGDMSGGRGRPRTSLLGPERKQIDLLVGVQVMRLLEAEYERNGIIIDPEMAMYLTDKGRRIFVGAILNGMSRFNLREEAGAPIATLFKSSGKFIRIRSAEPARNGGAGRYRYIAKRTAKQMEVLAAFNTQRDEEETRAGIVTSKLEAYAVAIKNWPGGSETTFEEAFAQEAAKRMIRSAT